MMKNILFLLGIASVFTVSCKNTTGSITRTVDSEIELPAESKSFYFDFILDGKEMHVDAAEIVSTYYPDKHNQFTIYAGKDDSVLVSLTVAYDIRKPSFTPSGSPDPYLNIQQGSISLHDYPEKNHTSDSYSSAYPENTPVTSDAIIITGSEKEGKVARIITGSFQAKTYSDNKKTDPKNTDHFIKGKFRIRHEFASYNGGQF